MSFCLLSFRSSLMLLPLLLIQVSAQANCNVYASKSVKQQEQNVLSLCGYRGGHWSSSFKRRFQECSTMSERDQAYRLKHRRRLLEQCEQRQPAFKRSLTGQSRDLQLANALHEAISRNNLRLVQMLVQAGASVNYDKRLPSSPLMHALTSDALHIVRYLLAKGANPRRLAPGELNPVIHALRRNPANHTLLRSLLAAGGDPNATSDKPKDEYPLVIAIKQGRYWAVDALLRYKADPNLYKKRSALLIAVEMDSYPAVRALIKHGARVNLGENRQDCKGELALDLAYYYSGDRIIDLLLDNNALTQQECDER